VRTILFCIIAYLANAARAADKIHIEEMLFEGGAGTDWFHEAAREYENARPDIKIDEFLDPRILNKVQVRILEGSFPEITNAFLNYWPLIHNGDVLDLAPYLDGPNWEGDAKWCDTFLPGSLEPYSENGKIYGLPLPYYASVIWYNKKMFREHDWTPPRTWDELFALCDKVKAAGISPIAFQGRYSYYAQPLYDFAYYHLAGKDRLRSRDLLEPGGYSSPESAQAIGLVRRLAKDYFQAGALGMSHTESQMQFFLGNTAMIPCGSWLISEMKGKIPGDFELGAFNIPIVEPTRGDPTAVITAVEPFFIMSHSKHPREAVDFFRFMTSRKMAGRFAKLQDIATAVKGANEGNLSPAMEDLFRIVDAAKSSFGVIPGEGFPEMKQVDDDMTYRMIAGSESPEEVAKKWDQRAQEVRNRSKNPDHVIVNHIAKPVIFLGLLGIGAVVGLIGLVQGVKRLAIVRLRGGGGLQRLRLGNVLLFVAPAVIVYSLFVTFPCLRAFFWSLHEWNGLTPMQSMPLTGLLNFRRLLFESDGFWIALNNNLFLMFVVPLFVIPLSLFLAAAISRGVWGAKWFRIIFFFPILLGSVASTLLWQHFYNPVGGPLNALLQLLGFSRFEAFTWLEPKHLYWSLIPISIWGACGFNMVLYLAAMENVPESLYESATIDGASQWRQFWAITLPLIWEILAISIVFLVIGGMKAFDLIWLLTNQAPTTDSHTIATMLVQKMFTEFRIGEATAIAVLLFLMVFIGSAATLRVMRRETVEI
jgi:raffinose/stachyose/melibiose transport system permease protein